MSPFLALNTGDGAAFCLPVRGGNAWPSPDRGRHRAHEELKYIPDQRWVKNQTMLDNHFQSPCSAGIQREDTIWTPRIDPWYR